MKTLTESEKISLLAELLHICQRNTIAVNCSVRYRENPALEQKLVKKVLSNWIGREASDAEIELARGV